MIIQGKIRKEKDHWKYLTIVILPNGKKFGKESDPIYESESACIKALKEKIKEIINSAKETIAPNISTTDYFDCLQNEYRTWNEN